MVGESANGVSCRPAVQTKVRDLVQIAPHDFSKKSLTAIEDNINTKFANKASYESRLPVTWPVG